MSHHIYHTRGIILGSIAIGEANRFYKIFTEELGLVWVSAQSVRMEKSKLRYSLQHYVWVTLDLVKGREVWRITSAQEDVIHTILRTDTKHFKMFAEICALVSRMVHGERQEEGLFKDLFELANFLEQKEIPDDLVQSFQVFASARVLAWLGYFDDSLNEQFTKTDKWSIDMLKIFEKEREAVSLKIDEALHASHL
ncbi:MAG: DNA repair protein RecO [Candidatus Yonathbacteria bacterium]|nr:DNA repair protein RecO [Candidatus Yonathbacteria bacterium]